MDNDTAATAREGMRDALAEATATLEGGTSRVTSLLTSVSAWLATTIVALNGALIPIIFSSPKSTDYPKLALFFAVIGLAASLVSAGVFCVYLGEAADANRMVLADIKAVNVDGDLTQRSPIDTSPTDRIVAAGPRVAAWLAIGPIFFIASVATFAAGYHFDDEVNDRRCAAIQRDMLAAHSRLADGPNIFQALGCSPTGTDPRIYVPPTDRERAAGRALPDGGYPPPR